MPPSLRTITIVSGRAYHSPVSDVSTVRSSTEAVAQRLLEAFRPNPPRLTSRHTRDLTLGQLRILFMIRADGPLSIGGIAEMFGVGQAAASGFAERIEKHGLVERQHRTDDRRVVECHLTAAGERLLDDLAGIQVGALQRALDTLSHEELNELDRLLTAIVARRGGKE